MGKIAVFIITEGGFKGIEGQTAQRVLKRLLCEDDDRTLDLYEIERDDPLKISDVIGYQGYDVFILIHGNLFITQEGINLLAKIAVDRQDLSAIVPVTNLSKVSQQIQPPPFFYQTISVFKWAQREIYEQFRDKAVEVEEIDDFCLAFRREALEGLPEDVCLTRLPGLIRQADLIYGIAKGVYAHRYGDLYESAREDLIGHVPLDSRNILDIGCANGLFGQMLKKRQSCVVTGIECDTELVNMAKARLDNVINGDIEEIIDRGSLGRFDCILCGDILEHLNDPWKVVGGLKRHLKKGGLFIASVPNIANWAIIYEMLKGRWDYVPFSILSGTHLRFFTRHSLKELFEDAGYRIREIYFQGFEVPAEGAEFIGMLKKNLPEINVEELKASEIVVIAERA
jgi:2-polyprenyl-3-methyl-5-hydroxy-6-metoxy-1,4-benzoquinol methylase